MKTVKTVSQKKAKGLQDAGWVRETYWISIFNRAELIHEDLQRPSEEVCKAGRMGLILLRPTLDELLKNLTPDDVARYVIRNEDVEKLHGISLMRLALQQIWTADKAADVWIKTRRKE